MSVFDAFRDVDMLFPGRRQKVQPFQMKDSTAHPLSFRVL